MKISKNNTIVPIFYYAVFILIWAFLFYICRFGYVSNDEAFYLTLSYRYSQGDGLFVHEWHRALVTGYLGLPFTVLYKLFFKTGTEGILLHFRYYFTLVWGLLSLFLQKKLEKYNYVGSCIASLLFLIFTPFGIPAFSYNTFGIGFLLLSLVILCTNENRKKINSFLAGFLFAHAVLACPFLVIMYVLYCAYIFVYKKSDRREWLYSFMGIMLAAAIFVAFVLSRASVSKLIASIPYILEDPERVDTNIFMLPIEYINIVLSSGATKKYIYLVYLIEIIICLIDKKRRNHRDYYFLASVPVAIVDLLFSYFDHVYIQNLLYPISMLGIVFLLYLDDSDIRRLFLYIWLPGMIYTVLLHMSSNTQYHAICNAVIVADVAVCIMLFKVKLDKMILHKVKIVLLFVLLSIQISSQMYVRYNENFGTDETVYQTNLVEMGPEKGIYMSDYRFSSYTDTYEDIVSLKMKSGAKVLFLSRKTWLYLIDGSYRYATYSSWLSTNPERLLPFYEMNEEKLPEYIFADEDYFDIAHILCEKYSYQLTETKAGNLFCYK